MLSGLTDFVLEEMLDYTYHLQSLWLLIDLSDHWPIQAPDIITPD